MSFQTSSLKAFQKFLLQKNVSAFVKIESFHFKFCTLNDTVSPVLLVNNTLFHVCAATGRRKEKEGRRA